jgi:ElaB/YqjD/DUF883 family membrane-anchored ribosome-binding protein
MNRHTAAHTTTHAMEAANNIGKLVEQSKEFAGNVRNRAVAGAKATHKAVTENPYKAVGIALGIGAILGLLLARRGSGKSEKSE